MFSAALAATIITIMGPASAQDAFTLANRAKLGRVEGSGDLNAVKVKRFGDKSLENVIRTDDRYGHDGLFQGPRGWGYWNYLEYPRPIQNPNLWPDMQSTYFIGRLAMPAGSSLTLTLHLSARALFPVRALQGRTRHASFPSARPWPDRTSNLIPARPIRSRSARTGWREKRNFTLRIVAKDAPPTRGARAEHPLRRARTAANSRS